MKETWQSLGHQGTIDVEPVLGFEVDRLLSEDGTKLDIGLYLNLSDRYVRVRVGRAFVDLIATALDKTHRAIEAQEAKVQEERDAAAVLVARAPGP